MAIVEGCGVAELCGHLGWGAVSAPADILRGPAGFPLEKVGVRAARRQGYSG